MATIAGQSVNVINDSIRPEAELALEWAERDIGSWSAYDRGVSADAYFGTFDVRGSRTAIDNLAVALEGANREQITVSFSSGEPVFGPDVTATLATVVKYPRQVRVGYGYWALDGITLRAISPSFASIFPSLSAMRLLRNRYESTTDWRIRKHFSINGTAVYTDRRADFGTFKATFRNTNSEYQLIRRTILEHYRASVITFPSIQGITYPWGARGPSSGGDCRIKSLSNERRAGLGWEYEVEFARERT